jgi:uncharacterized protein (TIGR02301 family)
MRGNEKCLGPDRASAVRLRRGPLRDYVGAILMKRIPTIVFLALCLALGLAAGPAWAQFQFPFQYAPPRPQAPPRPRAPQPPPVPQDQQSNAQPRAASAPYDNDLKRLSEILGALHFLRSICGTNEGPKWRNEAQALIDAEAPAGDRHDQMIASFNRGYRGFQQSYRTCTPAADVAIRRYLDEGAKIAREITARYAN